MPREESPEAGGEEAELAAVVASADETSEEAGSASGSLSAVQQLAAATGSAVITMVLFGRLGHGGVDALRACLLVAGAIGPACVALAWLMPRTAPSEQHPSATATINSTFGSMAVTTYRKEGYRPDLTSIQAALRTGSMFHRPAQDRVNVPSTRSQTRFRPREDAFLTPRAGRELSYHH